MKIKCNVSGVTFQLNEFAGAFSNEGIHPIFQMKVEKVIGKFLAPALSEKLEETEVHLLGTYLLSNLPVERWESPLLDLAPLTYWSKFWPLHLEKLAACVTRMNGKNIKRLPTLAVCSRTGEGKPLSNLKDWLADLNLAINEYYTPLSDEARKRNRLFRAEIGETQYNTEESCTALIEKALRGSLLSPREKEKFPAIIANWAAVTGKFPKAVFTTEDHKRTTISDFWKNIIRAAFEQEGKGTGVTTLLLEGVTVADLEELIEHCSVNIPVGTLHSAALFKELEKVKEVIEEFRPGTSGRSEPLNLTIEVLSSKEVSALLSEVSHLPSATPVTEYDPLAPKKEDYPSLTAYVRARARYAETKKLEEAK